MSSGNLLYAQSGGVTAVINATACGVIETARGERKRIGKVLAARNGIVGVLREELIDTSKERVRDIAALRHTPGGAFGSCRFKLKSLKDDRAHYERLLEVFKAHDIRYFLYNGGNDSADTGLKVSQIADKLGYEVNCIALPKTVDNDLVGTDSCPGFGSVAKYVAVSTLEASFDVESMAESSTKVFVLEVMGRHAGWIAAAAGLAGREAADPPHVILFPEVVFDKQAFLARVKHSVESFGYCTVVVSEGLLDENGKFVAEGSSRDAFGHVQLGGVGPRIAEMVKEALGYKYHWAVADYLQRSARHIASRVDVEQAYAVGKAGVKLALEGHNSVLAGIKRLSDDPYEWSIEPMPLKQIANKEKVLPKRFITRDGFGITEAARRYLEPLIKGQDAPPYRRGLPRYVRLRRQLVETRLARYELD